MNTKLLFSFLSMLSVQQVAVALDGQKIDNYLQGCKNFSGAVLIAQGDKIILNRLFTHILIIPMLSGVVLNING